MDVYLDNGLNTNRNIHTKMIAESQNKSDNSSVNAAIPTVTVSATTATGSTSSSLPFPKSVKEFMLTDEEYAKFLLSGKPTRKRAREISTTFYNSGMTEFSYTRNTNTRTTSAICFRRCNDDDDYDKT